MKSTIVSTSTESVKTEFINIPDSCHGQIRGSHYEQGWVCPRCGQVNAPWKDHCDCKKGELNNWRGLPGDSYNPSEIDTHDWPNFIYTKPVFLIDPCDQCLNSPKNGGSGICNCTLCDRNKVMC